MVKQARDNGRIAGAGARTADAIRRAAIDLFFSHGYESASLREIAGVVGIQVGSLYNHIPSKEDLLYEIMSGVIEDLLRDLDQNLEGLTDPAERLAAAVKTHVMFHAERAKEVFIGNSELRSLSPDHRAHVVGLRDAYEQRIASILQEGAANGLFDVPDSKLLAYAIMSIGTQVSSWYRPDGRYELSDISALYGDFILRGLTPRKATAGSRRRS